MQARGTDLLVQRGAGERRRAHHGGGPRARRANRASRRSWRTSYHTSPADAAGGAVAAGVRLLALTHLPPPPDNVLLARVFRRDVNGALLPDVGDVGLRIVMS